MDDRAGAERRAPANQVFRTFSASTRNGAVASAMSYAAFRHDLEWHVRKLKRTFPLLGHWEITIWAWDFDA